MDTTLCSSSFSNFDSARGSDLRIDFTIGQESQLREYLDYLRNAGITTIAIDLEGDQGTIRYKYSISIIQCFDGLRTAIIDVLSVGTSDLLREFLTCNDITKVMFSCQNDLFMTQNVLGCTIKPVRDIAVGQKLLGLPINIADYLNIDKKEKDKFQRANWLKRPLGTDLLEYAIKDVLLLLQIEQQIQTLLAEKDLLDAYHHELKTISDKNFIIDQYQQYKVKFPGFKSLPFALKQKAGILWIFRELLGQKFNCPVGYVLSKKQMCTIIRSDQDTPDALELILNEQRNSTRKLGYKFIRQLYTKAKEMHSVYLKEDVNSKRKYRPKIVATDQITPQSITPPTEL